MRGYCSPCTSTCSVAGHVMRKFPHRLLYKVCTCSYTCVYMLCTVDLVDSPTGMSSSFLPNPSPNSPSFFSSSLPSPPWQPRKQTSYTRSTLAHVNIAHVWFLLECCTYNCLQLPRDTCRHSPCVIFARMLHLQMFTTSSRATPWGPDTTTSTELLPFPSHRPSLLAIRNGPTVGMQLALNKHVLTVILHTVLYTTWLQYSLFTVITLMAIIVSEYHVLLRSRCR